MARLAIQVILYYSDEKIETLKASLDAQTFRDFEVFYRDNSIEENIGFAGGHVELFKRHQSPFVMLLNDDTKLDPQYLEHAMNRIESDDRIGSVTGLVYRWDGKTIDTSGLDYRCMARVLDRHTAPESAGEVFGVSGAVGLYRSSAIEKAGGLFDPTWFMYKEDVDLAIRLRRAGFIGNFEPRAIAWHKRGVKEEGSGLIARFVAERKRPTLLRQCAYRNQHHIYTLHAAPSLGFDDFFRSLVNELARSFLVFITSPIVWFRAVSSLAQSFPRMWKRRKELEKLGLPHIRMIV
ncbi:glycosyltransferase [Candidatus Uhrbacteria bacterium]|nr:glycosyltransferase [Candidatus Uhrbacteria bacterium]